MRYYIAGPMRGHPNLNVDAFMRAEDFLLSIGQSIQWNPARLVNTKRDAALEIEFRRDFANLLQSQVVLFLPGWENSVGASAEFLVARLIDLPCYVFRDGSATGEPSTMMGIDPSAYKEFTVGEYNP